MRLEGRGLGLLWHDPCDLDSDCMKAVMDGDLWRGSEKGEYDSSWSRMKRALLDVHVF